MVHAVLIFAASIGGLLVYFTDAKETAIGIGAVLLVVCLALTIEAHRQVKSHPRRATRLFVAWRAVPLAFIFLGAMSSVWLSLNILDVLPVSFSDDPALADRVKAEKATLQSLATTAVTTLLAAVLLDAARDPDSWFWPGAMHRRALKAAFDKSPAFKADRSDTSVRQALEDLRFAYAEERTFLNEASGWSYAARLERARIIENATATLRGKGIAV